ncbi:hypothetical protein K458DRAFT_131706 [Lentithecium fluviatile CBS 122367]|uniref:Uncharacterized protein n=1 Tax=Lentithecium fluviatile CBS 122367 TaxID=1168545 RepID=A0A6G1JHV6_9PLEO|nr:hypothetical protein K458DRAFT_131706 [Lentithecium fluviatile CBS 122367]
MAAVAVCGALLPCSCPVFVLRRHLSRTCPSQLLRIPIVDFDEVQNIWNPLAMKAAMRGAPSPFTAHSRWNSCWTARVLRDAASPAVAPSDRKLWLRRRAGIFESGGARRYSCSCEPIKPLCGSSAQTMFPRPSQLHAFARSTTAPIRRALLAPSEVTYDADGDARWRLAAGLNVDAILHRPVTRLCHALPSSFETDCFIASSLPPITESRMLIHARVECSSTSNV